MMDPISSSPFPLQTQWTFEENKIFENALAEFDHVFPDLFEKIACRLPGKTIDQIKEHYETLVHDVEMIEVGLVPLPNYEESDATNLSSAHVVGYIINQQQRRKPNPWTSEEHELFLEGLEKYGKGDWRSISRNCVISKTPTQVASHAQKHFLRLERNMASTTTSTPKRNPTSKSEGGSPSTMSSPNLSTSPPPPPFMSVENSLVTTRLPSFSDFSTIEELDQLCASYSSSYDRQQ